MQNQVKTFLFLTILTGILLFFGSLVGGRVGLIFAFILALVMNLGSYWFSDKIVLAMYRAREIPYEEMPFLHQMVEELSAKANIPKPKIYLLPQDVPNAFATGRDPKHAVVAVTAGILKILSPEELKGVLAHELGHIKNRDILIQTIAATVAGTIMFVADIVKWGVLLGFGSDDEDAPNPIVALVVAIIAPFAAMLVQMAISRSREYLADETGARLCGNPEYLASALEKLDAYSRNMIAEANPATAHMFIVNPLNGQSLANLFSTHPPIEDRVRRLRSMHF
ncbi:MAG: zinc metalloprotease HtpX [Desulfonauticus sp.]|nr:zinc metalloprotease HtpX [Desulfonauticus sp.]